MIESLSNISNADFVDVSKFQTSGGRKHNKAKETEISE